MRKLLATAFCALLLSVTAHAAAPKKAPLPPAPAASEPSSFGTADFVEVVSYPEWSLAVDPKSHLGSFTEGYSVVTVRIRLSKPMIFKDVKVIGYVNTVFIDCAKDQLTVLVSQVFNEAGQRFSVARFYEPIDNMHQAGVPISETLDLLCADHEAYPRRPNTPRPDGKKANP